MGHPIAAAPLGRNVDNFVCCWPRCTDRTDGYPLCWRHALSAWRMVNDSARAVLDSRAQVDPIAAPRAGFVYFVRFRDRVKIGYSDNPDQRLRDIPHDEVLAVIPGTMADEKRCHAAFAHLREQGEWFRAEPELIQWATAG